MDPLEWKEIGKTNIQQSIETGYKGRIRYTVSLKQMTSDSKTFLSLIVVGGNVNPEGRHPDINHRNDIFIETEIGAWHVESSVIHNQSE